MSLGNRITALLSKDVLTGDNLSKWKSSNKDISKPKEKDSKKPKKEKEQKHSKNSKGKCFHCDGGGHWKRNCPVYLAELAEKKKNIGMTDLYVLEAFYAEDTSSTWIVDSGATNHVCSSLQLLSSWRELKDGDLTLKVGNGESVTAKAVGEARLTFGNKFLVLESVYFIPCFSRNLISVSELCKHSFSISFNNNSIIISRNGLEICSANMEYGLYILRPMESFILNTEIFRVANPKPNKKPKVSSDSETYLWHLRLGHINLDRINRLTKEGPFRDLRVGSLPVCEF